MKSSRRLPSIRHNCLRVLPS